MKDNITRRKFIHSTSFAVAGLTLSANSFSSYLKRTKIKAIAFDGFPIFDPRPVFKKVNDLFPEKGKQLVEVWKAKQFSYQWLRASAKKYKNFLDVTQDALLFAAKECDLAIDRAGIEIIMSGYRNLNIWPDVIPVLRELKSKGIKLSFLTNMTEEMIMKGLQNSNTKEYFEHIISTDKIRTYKPDPNAYQAGIDILKLRKEEILFVAFAGWDMAGAKWFGYPTFWVNRQNSTADQLDAVPDGAGNNLNDLLSFVTDYNK